MLECVIILVCETVEIQNSNVYTLCQSILPKKNDLVCTKITKLQAALAVLAIRINSL